MLLQVILFCFLANIWLVQSTNNVIVSVIRSRSTSPEEHDEKIRGFWTPEKCAAAKSMDIILTSSPNRTIFEKSNVTNRFPLRIQGSSLLNNRRSIRAIFRNDRQVSTVGKVFWQVGIKQYTCSAAVVSSQSGDLIVTAAHCAYDTDTQTWYNNNNWVFIPGFSNNKRPYGIWPARNFIANQAWMSMKDFNYDVAFVTLSTFNEKHIEQVVGSQGIAFNEPRLKYTMSFGYPSNLDSGLLLRSCNGYTQNPKYTGNSYIGQALSCNMGKGSSGGPWVQYTDEFTGTGYVTSVNSFGLDIMPNVMYGPYFETNIKSLYDEASAI